MSAPDQPERFVKAVTTFSETGHSAKPASGFISPFTTGVSNQVRLATITQKYRTRRSKWTNDLYRCPEYRGHVAIPRNDLPSPSPPSQNYLGSYGYNSYDDKFSLVIPGAFDLRVRESEVRVPGAMIAVGDGNLTPYEYSLNDNPFHSFSVRGKLSVTGWGFLDKTQGSLSSWPANRQADSRKAVSARHTDRYNIAFSDGHVETIKHDKLYEKTDNSLRRWNRNHEPIP